ncbi:hypothetical protein FZEAL_4525 [Fusarium zealandicum]|uniref:Alpha/beta hydrolase fold-3 domain-containing protein n=1 Tax=Fusarium zealandicum TaxID=1053134 RepID=A0A8H4XLC1_9HYPO|nr:hypothetical protein FZEAL_4525 [Fusarium zealandicum]
MATKPKKRAVSLGPWDWALVLSQATGITFGLMFKATKALFSRRKNLHEYIAYEGMRDYQSQLGAVPIQNLLPTTTATCVRFARRHGLAYSTLQLPQETTAIRLGSSNAKDIRVLFHGGGYMAAVLDEHLSFACGFSKPLKEDVAVFVLQYSLASEHANHYPRQLQEAVWLLELLFSRGIPPMAITLVGDSAGGHLLLSLLLHLTHPNPQVSPLELSGRLSGAALISPWVELKSTSESMKTNSNKDVLEAAALDYWAGNFLGDSEPDPWNSPLTAPAEWWSNLPVDRILVTYGDNELLRDDIGTLCDLLQSHSNKLALRFAGELHVHMVMNRFLRINKPCESEETLNTSD